VFRLDIVVAVELELEDVVVRGEVDVDEVDVDEVDVDEVDVDEVGVNKVDVDGVDVNEIGVDEVGIDEVEVGGGTMAKVAVAPHSSRVSLFRQQPILVQ